jgi:hypothetical protein
MCITGAVWGEMPPCLSVLFSCLIPSREVANAAGVCTYLVMAEPVHVVILGADAIDSRAQALRWAVTAPSLHSLVSAVTLTVIVWVMKPD